MSVSQIWSSKPTNWLLRNLVWWGIQFIDVTRGVMVAETAFDGPTPPTCPDSQAFSDTERWVDGGPASADSIAGLLRQ